MGMFFCCAAKLHDDISCHGTVSNKDGEHDNSYSKVHSVSLLNLPAELLVKILCYLPIYDRIRIRYVCRRFQDVSEIPLLWEEFVWSYKPHHVRMVSNILKVYGGHVRQINFPKHLTPAWILEIARYCVKVTHLSLSEGTQLALHHLEEIMYTMKQLQQLDVLAYGNFIQRENHGYIERLLKITAGSVKELKLRVCNQYQSMKIIGSIQKWVNQGYSLPSVINIYSKLEFNTTFELFKFWSLSSSNLPSFEISLYDNIKLPMNLYPPVPLRKFKFGPAATPPLIKLSTHGIVGLKFDIFYIHEYDHYGTIKHVVIPEFESDRNHCPSLIEKKHFNYTSHLHSVSYVDISNLNVCSSHLEQLAVVCPNLQQLNLQGNDNCLKDLQGLRAIINTCENLEILSLDKIPVSWVESFLLLWELLSSLKKLTHLVIDLCMVKLYDGCDDADKQKLITMFKQCHSLQSMEIYCRSYCTECSSNTDFFFSYFLSLTYCKMFDFRYSGIVYAITNCHQLKSLSEINNFFHQGNYSSIPQKQHQGTNHSEEPLLNNCHLVHLCISSSYNYNLSDELVEVLSAHGELETVNLQVNSITINGINTLIMNSPNLISLCVTFRNPSEDVSRYHDGDYEERARKMFPYHKLFDIGNVVILRC